MLNNRLIIYIINELKNDKFIYLIFLFCPIFFNIIMNINLFKKFEFINKCKKKILQIKSKNNF